MVPSVTLPPPSFWNVVQRWMNYLGCNTSDSIHDYAVLSHRIWTSPMSPAQSNSTLLEGVVDHPLSESENSVWRRYFTLENVRTIVLKDVQRTFPDEPFFRTPDLQSKLTQLLCVYCIDHQMHYTQGMHELCALLLWVVTHDPSVPQHGILAHAYALFQAVMHLQRALFESDTAAKLSVRFFQVHVRAMDPALYHHLSQLGVEPHLFGLRWVRLLLCREFPLIQVAQLWEGLFALYSKRDRHEWFETLSYVCATLLVSASPALLPLDYTHCMQALMQWTAPVPARTVLQTMVEHRHRVAPIVFDLTVRNPNTHLPPSLNASRSSFHSA